VLRNYFGLLRDNGRAIGFGLVFMTISSFGQTFFISLFGADIRREFSLSDGEFGALYAGATVASALTMVWAGRGLDRTSLRRFASIVLAGLATACVLAAWSPGVATLVAALFLLRLMGQGLSVHTAMTAVARAVPADRGKALGIAALGLALGEALLPLLAVWGTAVLGWRAQWLVNGGLVVVGGAIVMFLLPKNAAAAPVGIPRSPHSDGDWRGSLLADSRFLYRVPALLCSPFIATGLLFHQVRMANEKGWSLQWIASCFVGYAVIRALALVAVGPLIDHLGPRRLLLWLPVPVALALLMLATSSGQWVALAYLVMLALAGAGSATIGTAVWVEIYGAQHLGRVRATTEGANVLASGAAPVAMGLLIDAGVPLSQQAAGLLLLPLLATALAVKTCKRA
jgi:MFS family permease